MVFNLFRQVLTFKTDTTSRFLSEDEEEEQNIQLSRSTSGYSIKDTKTNTAIMNTQLQESSKKGTVVANPHTGFPEPFCEDRNTTLPHPEADTSPNATIEAPDFDLTRTHSRGSMFERRHHKHQHRIWGGKHDAPEKIGLCEEVTYVGEEMPVGGGTGEEEVRNEGGGEGGERERDGKKGILKKLTQRS